MQQAWQQLALSETISNGMSAAWRRKSMPGSALGISLAYQAWRIGKRQQAS